MFSQTARALAALLIVSLSPVSVFSQVGGFIDQHEVLTHYGSQAQEIRPGVVRVSDGGQIRTYGFGYHAMVYTAELLRDEILALRRSNNARLDYANYLADAEEAYWTLTAHLGQVVAPGSEKAAASNPGLSGTASDSGLLCTPSSGFGWGLSYTLDVYALEGGSNFWGVHALAEATGNANLPGPFPEFEMDMNLYAQASYTASELFGGQTFTNSDSLYIPDRSSGALGPVTIDSGYQAGQASASALAFALNQHCAAHGFTNDFAMISAEWPEN